MKNYNVLALIDFYDKEEKVQREVGEETSKFKCSKERYEYLAGNNPQGLVAVKLLNIDEEKKEEVAEKEIKPKKATKRKVR